MANQPGVTLSSEDLMQLFKSGAFNVEALKDLDPNLVSVLQQFQGGNADAGDTGASQTVETSKVQSSGKVTKNNTSLTARGPYGKPATDVGQPYVELVEQPKARGLRFRYECEGRSAGSIPGENSTTEKKTFPAIKIHNYNGPAVIVVSCVTKDEPYKPHPHNLVGKDCKKGVCTLRIRDTNVVTFPHLDIQCAKKKDVQDNLKQRQEINVDPFQTGFKHKGQSLDLNVVRLCFQVFLPDESGRITRIVPPVVSHAIHDKKALNDLIIWRVDRTAGRVKGGDEVYLLCEKINRDDVRVRFYEIQDGQVVWEAFGDFGQSDVHRQYAIVFKTPPYKDLFISRPVIVYMQLQRGSDLEGSDPISFTYTPEDPDPDRILKKRKRKASSLDFLRSTDGTALNQEQLKQRLKLKATRTTQRRMDDVQIKQEGQEMSLRQLIQKHLCFLEEELDMFYLKDRFIEAEVFSDGEITSISASDTRRRRSHQLLLMLSKKDEDALKAFLHVLLDANEDYVIQHLLEESKKAVESPLPAYSFQNTGGQLAAGFAGIPNNPMSMDLSSQDTSSTTVFSQAAMSGGKVEIPSTSAPTQPSAPVTNISHEQLQQLHQLLQLQQLQNQQNPSAQAAGQMGTVSLEQNPALQNLLLTLNANAGRHEGAGDVMTNDPNLQAAASQNQDMTSLNSLLQEYIGGQEMENVSFSSLELQAVEADQNIGAFENVTSDNSQAGNQQMLDETTAAINALHQ